MKKTWVMGMVAVAIAGCNDSSDSPNSSAENPLTPQGVGFPSFYSLTREVLPAGLPVALGMQRQAREAFPTDYTTDESEFLRAFSVNDNFIGQVLNDAGESGPVKSMFVLLAQADRTMTRINTQYSDEQGNPANCNAINDAITVTTPFFAAATTPAFNVWDDAGKYSCYVDENDERILFGRQSVENAPADCTDPYEYFVMNANAVDDIENTEQVDERGETVDIASVEKFYYNGCSKDLRLAFAQSTRYSAGVEFSSRSEITGNTTTHRFSLRSHYIDASPLFAQHITLVGTGNSQPGEAGGAPAHFVMGYRADDCGDSSDSSTCTPGTAQTFCARNEGAANAYESESDSGQCASFLSEYQGITPLERSDLPSGYFDTSLSAFGL